MSILLKVGAGRDKFMRLGMVPVAGALGEGVTEVKGEVWLLAWR